MSNLEQLLRNLLDTCPMSCDCNDMHHTKSDYHAMGEECKPLTRYEKAVDEAAAYFLAKKEKEQQRNWNEIEGVAP